ncbi:mechanosensitive ion channel family protein [Salinimicrobium terrae]|uniref:mechanosensitive ion channel family protein n=1 Tax=Salinimicrobium terrae TaxID=470866 RepID=UPI00048B3894|nr:mechanosensitive ion channel family protein [Salinimicrobium terrae]
MTGDKKTEEEEIKKILEDEKVKKALLETDRSKKSSPQEQKGVFFLIGYTVLVLLIAGLIFYLLESRTLPISTEYIPLVKKLVLGTMLITTVLFLNRLLRKILRRKIDDKASAYNFKSLINFISFVLIVLIAISLIFSNWYATLVSFGVVSLILGLALQNPLTSLFGWLYLLLRKPYEVGDRIKIGTVYGDVMSVGYFDTTLWEFRGDYLSGDHPSGRIIKFANSRIFSEYVINYSWPLFPFIWNEVKFYVSYDSDFDFISGLVTDIAEKEVGEAMMRRVKRLKTILADSMIQELEIKERPSVIFTANNNTWIEVTVRFLVQPKNSGPTKSLLFTHIMKELKKHPEKVIFPNSNR